MEKPSKAFPWASFYTELERLLLLVWRLKFLLSSDHRGISGIFFSNSYQLTGGIGTQFFGPASTRLVIKIWPQGSSVIAILVTAKSRVSACRWKITFAEIALSEQQIKKRTHLPEGPLIFAGIWKSSQEAQQSTIFERWVACVSSHTRLVVKSLHCSYLSNISSEIFKISKGRGEHQFQSHTNLDTHCSGWRQLRVQNSSL